MLHITASVGENATFSLQKHRFDAELRCKFFQRGHGRAVYDFNIRRKIVGVNATEAAAGHDRF